MPQSTVYIQIVERFNRLDEKEVPIIPAERQAYLHKQIEDIYATLNSEDQQEIDKFIVWFATN